MTDSDRMWKTLSRVIRMEKPGTSVWLTRFTGQLTFRDLHFSKQALRMLNTPNAGGSSILSEVLSFEVLSRYLRAELYKMETEIQYFPKGGPMTDYVISVPRWSKNPRTRTLMRIAVSVVRLMTGPGQIYTLSDAERILHKKLRGIIQSNKTCQECWHQQLLHAWSPSINNTKLFKKAVHRLSRNSNADLLNNVIIIVSTAPRFPEIFYPRLERDNTVITQPILCLDKQSDGLPRLVKSIPKMPMKPSKMWQCHVSYFICLLDSVNINRSERTMELNSSPPFFF
ncbi:hypothetical protein D915_007895 [Fasciola hepatica]|uniref:Uncharacterized protein n=1 Tax=Fasciola hepatica TaxID=6192 RepID=A0A4E0RJZ6_FASHE|nr:hypothetical protein D915_007895 [Fasciola hepatica]